MFSKLKLRLKFTLIIGLVFLGGIILSGALLSRIFYQNTRQQVTNESLVLLTTIDSVRNYTDTRIEPLLDDKLRTAQKFIPETLPNFAARTVFDQVRQQKKYQNFFYKEAALNPTNLRDRADSFEASLIEQFRQNSNLKELDGFRTLGGDKLLYIARPLPVTQSSCLKCHSTPEAAPKSLLNSYGSQHGFGWQLNEIVAAQTLYVPVREAFTMYRQQFFLAMVSFTSIFALIALLINWLLKKTVIQPILPMARLAREISNDQIDSDSAVELDLGKLDRVAKRSDELGQLARVFQLMAEVVRTREQTLKQQLQQLRHENDLAQNLTDLMTRKGKIVRWQHLLEDARKARTNTNSSSDISSNPTGEKEK